MLWALALLGLVPAAIAVSEIASLGDHASGDDTASDDPATDTETSSTAGDPADVADLADPDIGDDVPPDDEPFILDWTGDDYDVALGSGETLFADFAVDVDHVTLFLDDGGQGAFLVEPLVDQAGNEIGTSLSYATDTDETILSFLGHESLPVDDISVSVMDPDSGQTTLYALSEMGDFGALAPNDPALPDEPGPASSGDEVPLAVNDPATPADPGPTGSDGDGALIPVQDDTAASTGAATGETVTYVLADAGETFVLADDPMQGGTDATVAFDAEDTPVIETDGTLNVVVGGAGEDIIATGDDAAIVDAGAGNDTLYGGDGTAILSGGEGDDTIYAGEDTGSSYVLSGDAGADELHGGAADDVLRMDVEDTASGGGGADEFWLYYNANADVGHARIMDFSEGEDVLRVTLNPDESYDGSINLQVTQTPDGASSQVVVNGDVVAVLYGAPNVTTDDVFVELSPSALSG